MASVDTSFGERALQEIVGNQLHAVTFVMDYVQLVFDGPMITAYSWPTIHIADRRLRRGEPTYRDELCARIAIRVAAVRAPGDAIELSFEDGATIRITLDFEGGPEAAEFHGSHRISFSRVDVAR